MLLLSGCTVLDQGWPGGAEEIVLTFDDGPSGALMPEDDPQFAGMSVSEALLDVLRRHEVRAVFCYIGVQMEQHPEVVRRALEDGHVIACHTWSHTVETLFDGELLEAEVARYEAFVDERAREAGLPGYAIEYFRPPIGLKSPVVQGMVKERDLQYAYVTLFKNDASLEPEGAAEYMEWLKRKLLSERGGAFVLHELRYRPQRGIYNWDKTWLPGAVEELIVWARAEGFTFTIYE